MRKSAINRFEIGHRRKENGATKLMLRRSYQTKTQFLDSLSFKNPKLEDTR